MKELNKTGQFYLMATIIIIGIVIGVLTISNYSVKKEQIAIYDFAEELEIEGERVIDYETTTSESEFDDFAEKYSEYAGNEKDVYFIVGELGDMEVFKYEGPIKQPQSYQMNGDNLTTTIDDIDYSFELKEGKNFHFVILENTPEEKYVVTN